MVFTWRMLGRLCMLLPPKSPAVGIPVDAAEAAPLLLGVAACRPWV